MYDVLLVFQVPSADEQAGNAFPPIFGQSDVAELNAWLDNRPLNDADIDAMWAQEQIRRDAEQAVLPVRPIRSVPSSEPGYVDYIDATGRHCGSARKSADANRQLRNLNAAMA